MNSDQLVGVYFTLQRGISLKDIVFSVIFCQDKPVPIFVAPVAQIQDHNQKHYEALVSQGLVTV
jgi:hypothetical protein